VRFWKAAHAVASTAGLVRNSNSSTRGRPVLMARVLNHQNSLTDKQQQQRKDGPIAGRAAGSSGAGVSPTMKACAQTAQILSRFVHPPFTVLILTAPTETRLAVVDHLFSHVVQYSSSLDPAWHVAASCCSSQSRDER
jgi:hypothetical protein